MSHNVAGSTDLVVSGAPVESDESYSSATVLLSVILTLGRRLNTHSGLRSSPFLGLAIRLLDRALPSELWFNCIQNRIITKKEDVVCR